VDEVLWLVAVGKQLCSLLQQACQLAQTCCLCVCVVLCAGAPLSMRCCARWRGKQLSHFHGTGMPANSKDVLLVCLHTCVYCLQGHHCR
jgi:hypothetical protein